MPDGGTAVDSIVDCNAAQAEYRPDFIRWMTLPAAYQPGYRSSPMEKTKMKCKVDCFTDQSVGSKFPENTYYADTLEQVQEIVRNVSRPVSGIVKVEVWFLQKDPK
jgi:hypothetical protein